MADKMYYSEEEAAEKLGVSVDELAGYVRDDKLRVFQDGARKMFKADEVDALLGGVTQPMDSGEIDLAYTSNFAREDYLRVVDKAKDYILAGDIFQVVPSQRLEAQTTAEPLAIYRALRVVNPSPYMFLLRCDEISLVGSSPRRGTKSPKSIPPTDTPVPTDEKSDASPTTAPSAPTR